MDMYVCVQMYVLYLVQQYIVNRLVRGEQRNLPQQGGILAHYLHLVELPSVCNTHKHMVSNKAGLVQLVLFNF